MDEIHIRVHVMEELKQLDERRTQLVQRLAKIDLAEKQLKVRQQTEAGITNSCPNSFWRADDSCSYCGSLNVADAIRLLKTDGTQYSCADWKYGWPHKFYVGSRKFYNSHLADATDAEFQEFNEISTRLFGVTWERSDKGISFYSIKGIQMHGVVGKEKEK